MIKQLGEKEKETLLGIYNNIWKQGSYPEEWRTALTAPIQKPGKDPENPGSYRPISLTSCLRKVMEKMVYRRLVHILEKRTDTRPTVRFQTWEIDDICSQHPPV
jgi:hypothetical protein